MLRGIVLGDLWGIEESVWVQLWSGTVGAIVSAGMAALVAVMVLTRSNTHQRKLAAEALAHQKALGEQQLAEQRAEAARVREQAAIAEVIIAAEQFMHVSRESTEELTRHLVVFQSAVARWRVELGPGSPLTGELMNWITVLFVAACDRHAIDPDDKEKTAAAFDTLARAITSFSTLALGWAAADQPLKEALLTRSARWRSELEVNVEPDVDPQPGP